MDGERTSKLRGFREAQRFAYTCVEAVAAQPRPGLWAVEPHLGFRGVGARFEKMLVVTEDDAYWLDDELPHVKRWQKAGLVGAA